jgi:hypothetical protein
LERHLYQTLPVIEQRAIEATDFELVISSAETALLSSGADDRSADSSVLVEEHVATLGAQLFSRHLIAVEVAGTLLLAALVGAIAIVGHDRPPPRHQAGRSAARSEGRS